MPKHVCGSSCHLYRHGSDNNTADTRCLTLRFSSSTKQHDYHMLHQFLVHPSCKKHHITRSANFKKISNHTNRTKAYYRHVSFIWTLLMQAPTNTDIFRDRSITLEFCLVCTHLRSRLWTACLERQLVNTYILMSLLWTCTYSEEASATWKRKWWQSTTRALLQFFHKKVGCENVCSNVTILIFLVARTLFCD